MKKLIIFISLLMLFGCDPAKMCLKYNCIKIVKHDTTIVIHDTVKKDCPPAATPSYDDSFLRLWLAAVDSDNVHFGQLIDARLKLKKCGGYWGVEKEYDTICVSDSIPFIVDRPVIQTAPVGWGWWFMSFCGGVLWFLLIVAAIWSVYNHYKSKK